MACSTFVDFDDQMTLRVLVMPQFTLPVNENLYIDIWRHLSASYLETARSACPGFVSYSATALQTGSVVSNPLIPRYDYKSALVQSSVDTIIRTICSHTQQSKYDTVLFTSFAQTDFTKVVLEAGMFFRDATSPSLRFYALADIISANPTTSTLCMAYKNTICVVLQTPLPPPTCTHPFINQTATFARLVETPNLVACSIQTSSNLPYPSMLAVGYKTGLLVTTKTTSITQVDSCQVGLSDSSGTAWSSVAHGLVENGRILVSYTLGAANVARVHLFRAYINENSRIVMFYTSPGQHVSIPRCTGIVCTSTVRDYLKSLRFQCLFDNDHMPDGSKWKVRIVSSTGHLVVTALSRVASGSQSCFFDYVVQDTTTNEATVTVTFGQCSQVSTWKTLPTAPFVFTAA